MDTLIPVPLTFRFSSFELNTRIGELRKHGLRIRLQEQPLQVLAVLLETPGELVTREELRRRVWPQDTFVDFDHALNTAVKKIRAALNDDADAPRYVETVPRRGYRFIAPVSPPSANVVAAEVDSTEPHGRLRIAQIFSSRPAIVALFTTIVVLALVFQLSGMRRKAGAAAAGWRPMAPGRVMVAVLPFQNISADPAQEYFSDGMTEETIAQLGRLNPEQLGVIARTSAMKYKHAVKTVDEIGRELHVDYVVEGSVRREGMRVRIAAQLIRTSDQSPRWSMNFDRSISDAISLETEVASAIANDIETTLGNHTPLQSVPAHQLVPGAYDAYLRGMSESSFRSEAEFQRVLNTFQEGLKMDPNSAMNWAALASAYDQAGNAGILSPREAFPKTREAALKAIALDPTHPDAHVYLADALLTVDFNWKDAEKEIQRALKLNPNDAIAHQWYGLFLVFKGETNEGFVEMKRALTLDPLSTERMVFLGGSALLAGRLEEARMYLKMAIEMDPDLAVAHLYLSYVFDVEVKQEQAVNELAEAYRLRGETEAEATLRQTYVSAGYEIAKKASLREDIAFWKKIGKQGYVPAYELARDYARLGEKEETINWLERAYEARDAHLLCVRSEQKFWFSSVKDDPRFQAIVDKLGYPH
jgi:TolB-like protein/DNA-binding winged helix-turn-helix (wHTH) protein/Tfp pilus assembly protein PilF